VPRNIDVREDDHLIVSADLPGLLIQGERKRAHEERRDGYYPSERS
jgi:hypothetical protein